MLQATLVLLFLADIASAAPQFNLPEFNTQNQQDLKTVAIKGIAKFKPGGSSMMVSLLIQGDQGLMPGTPGSAAGNTAQPPTTSAPDGSNVSPTSSGNTGGNQGSGSTSSPTNPGGASAGGSQGNDFEKESLDAHNKFRKVHGSQPMKLNREMCEQATAYAKKLAQTRRFQHASREERNGQGENLSMGCSTKKGQTGIEAVTNWYNEVCKPGYNFDKGRGQGGTGHFTQVVWNDSVELGIGKADSTEGSMKCTYIVGRYKPLGNFYDGNDNYKKNVKKGSFDRNAYCSNLKSSFDEMSDLEKIL